MIGQTFNRHCHIIVGCGVVGGGVDDVAAAAAKKINGKKQSSGLCLWKPLNTTRPLTNRENYNVNHKSKLSNNQSRDLRLILRIWVSVSALPTICVWEENVEPCGVRVFSGRRQTRRLTGHRPHLTFL